MPKDAPEPFWRKQAAALEVSIERARQDRFITLSDLHQMIPESTEPDEIEDLMTMLGEMGIDVVEEGEP